MAWVVLKIHSSAEEREWIKEPLQVSFSSKSPRKWVYINTEVYVNLDYFITLLWEKICIPQFFFLSDKR